ncbi:MAG: amidohydrolase, partial [Gammaproteobacteria bacterium]|nr:amidohydrolase [Gammaproteobacteria bacterium]
MKNILAAILIMFPALSLAGIAPAELDGLAADAQEQVVEWRRWLHQNPELGNREVNTSAYIAQALREMGLEPRTGIAHTGVVAVIQGGKPG